MAAIPLPYARAEDSNRHLWLLIGLGLFACAAAGGYALALHEMDALYVAVALVACIAVLFDFRIGVVALVLALPAGDTNVLPRSLLGYTGLNIVNVLLAGTLASYALRGRLEKAGRFLPQPLLWLYIAPIVIGGLIGMRHVDDIVPYFYDFELVHYTNEIGYLRDMVMRPLLLVVIALVLGAAVARSQKPERFIVPIAISLWIIALIQLGYILESGVRLGALASPRARTFFDRIGIHANDLGRMYVVAYALLLFVWWETKRQTLRTFLFLTIGLTSFVLLLTFSRGAYLGFLLVNFWLLAWKFNRKSVSLAVLALTIAVILMPDAVYNRIMIGMDSGDADEVSAGRIEGIWMPLLPELFKSPIWGNGLGALMWSYPMETGGMRPIGHVHNAYFEAVLDMGLAGLALLLAYFWHVWQGFRRLGSNAYLSPELRGFFQGATAGLLAFLVTGMAGSSLRPTGEFTFLWIAIGMMYGVLARRPTS